MGCLRPRTSRFSSLFALAVTACASDRAPAAATVYGPAAIDGFDPGPVPGGFVRYMTPPVRGIAPGTDALYCQWIADPFDDDTDIVAMRGVQSRFGHHVALYATTDRQAAGTSRPCVPTDMLSLRFLGFIGGETGGTSASEIPGVVFRVPRGFSLMANAHYLNPTNAPLDGQAAVDLNLSASDPNRQVASLFVNTSTSFTIAPHATQSIDLNCNLKQDLSIVLMADHMHDDGVAAFTEIVHADGTRADLVRDDTWAGERQSNPLWAKWPLDAPTVLHQGDVVHTRCTWSNPSSDALQFPTEMCAGIGFFLADGSQAQCVDGKWE